MINVTKEQLRVEKEIQEIVDLYECSILSYEEANRNIENLINDALRRGVFSREDIDGYIQRRDPKNSTYGTRTHIQFAMDLKRSHDNEKNTIEYFVNFLQMRGKNVKYESLGSDDNGYVMIANFWKRLNTPNRPDYKIRWGKEFSNIEVKNFKYKIWLKIDNLKKYREWNSYMLINFKGLYYLFSKEASNYLLKNIPYAPEIIHGKPSITITEEGRKSHFSLKKLIDMGIVKKAWR